MACTLAHHLHMNAVHELMRDMGMAEAMESDPSHPDGSDDLSEGLGDVIRIEHGPFRPGEYKVALPKAKSQPLRCLFRSMAG